MDSARQSNQSRRCGAALMVALGLAFTVASAHALELRPALGALRASTPEVRRIFVEVAVATLADRFLVEARGSTDDGSWARHTRGYVADLWRAVDVARAGGVVSLIEDPDNSLRVVVSGAETQQFSLMPPRPGERREVEAEVIAKFCISVDCSYLERELIAAQSTTEPGMAQPIGRKLTTPDRRELGDGRDGLSCNANGGPHLRLRQSACARVTTEARNLASVLQRSQQSGLALEWGVLADPLWKVRGQELLVTADGITVSVDAPLLGRYPVLMKQLMPWMRAWLSGQVRTHSVQLPERLIYAARANPSSQ